MDKDLLTSRIRQILAIDKNAYDLYTDLAVNVDDKKLKEQFALIARDEKRHVIFLEEILVLLKG